MAPKKKVGCEIVYLRDKTCIWDLMSGLNELRKQNIMCDVNIKVEDDSYPAHKVVLGIYSEYFKQIFTSEFKETTNSEVNIEEGSSVAFATLLRFAYSGNLRLSADTVLDVFSMASYLQFPKAIALCVEFYQDICKHGRLSFEDLLTVADLGEKHRLAELSDAANDYIADNIADFAKTNVFLLQSTELVIKFLQSPSIARQRSEHEIEILDAVLAWLKHDWLQRRSDSMKLLREVRIGLVPKEHLQNKITQLKMMPEVTKVLRDVSNLLKDVGDQHPLTLARDYPKLCATRTMVTAPMVASHKHGSFYYDKGNKDWVSMPFCGPQVEGKRWFTFNHTFLVANGELYAAGGLYQTVESRHLRKTTASFSRYNPCYNNWIGLDSMKVARSQCTLVALDEHIYAISGAQDASVERYNVKSGKWSQPYEIAALPVKRVHSSISAVAFEGQILVFAYPNFYLYHPATNRWYDQRLLAALVRREPKRKKVNSLLTLHNGQCYFVSYINVLDGSQDVPMTKPVVNQLFFSTCNLATKYDTVETKLKSLLSQKLVPINSYGAFIIDDEVFVNINGCVHNTGTFVKESQTEKVKLEEWKKLPEKQAFISYTIDQFNLRKKEGSTGQL